MLILAAAAGVMAILLLVQVKSGGTPAGTAPPAEVTAAAVGAVDATPGDSGVDAASEDAGPPVWRVASLANDPAVEIVGGSIGKQRSLLAALTALGVPTGEALRVAHAFEGVRTFDDPGPKEAFSFARDKASGKILGFEYTTSPVDVWQARPNDTNGDLQAEKLPLHMEKKRVAVGLAVGPDLRTSIIGAGLDDDLLPLLDDALDGHAELSDLRPGARLRLLAVEDRAGGAFQGYESLEAVEYTPSGGEAKPLRVYYFARAPETSWLARGKSQNDAKESRSYFYDAKGRQPMQGGWKSPVPFARIASRFNPKRMHPVLHVIMPHNGVDFAAPPGTPVYAAAEGTLKSAANSGPCGNMVQINHPSGYTTAYCHLSRFAPGLHPGERIEAHQLIGYVGSTGRTTGPHLHFAVKKGDRFIDPLALRLDGQRVVPLADRAEFDRQRAELDVALDEITLPAPAVVEGDAGAAAAAVEQVDAGADEFDETP